MRDKNLCPILYVLVSALLSAFIEKFSRMLDIFFRGKKIQFKCLFLIHQDQVHHYFMTSSSRISWCSNIFSLWGKGKEKQEKKVCSLVKKSKSQNLDSHWKTGFTLKTYENLAHWQDTATDCHTMHFNSLQANKGSLIISDPLFACKAAYNPSLHRGWVHPESTSSPVISDKKGQRVRSKAIVHCSD